MEYLRRKNEKTAEFFAGKTPVLRAEKTREREIFRELKPLFYFLCKSYVTLMLLLCSSYLKWELYGIYFEGIIGISKKE